MIIFKILLFLYLVVTVLAAYNVTVKSKEEHENVTLSDVLGNWCPMLIRGWILIPIWICDNIIIRKGK